MNILVTGSGGFVGRNLVENLKNLRDGKNRTRPGLHIEEIYEFDRDTELSVLDKACERADFVFHFAGVNRPQDNREFIEGNVGAAADVLVRLKSCRNLCPVMFASSVQASLSGRFEGSEYGKSKLAGEGLLFRYARETGAPVLVYRFPNLFGKWCRPNYNSAVATFCHATANGLPYTVNDPATELTLLYIDDLLNEMLDALEGREHHCDFPQDETHDGTVPVPADDGKFCYVPTTYRVTLQEIVEHLETFRKLPETLLMPGIPEGSFAKKLYSTWLTYLPADAVAFDLHMNRDERGIFTELLKTNSCGQFSINMARPGNVRGQHWHNSKWEIFIVVSGHGLIRERRLGIDPETGQPYPMIEFDVTGEEMKAIRMLPGYAHSITNLSETDNLVTVMWANEQFDESHPDTFYERVEGE